MECWFKKKKTLAFTYLVRQMLWSKVINNRVEKMRVMSLAQESNTLTMLGFELVTFQFSSRLTPEPWSSDQAWTMDC